MAQWLEGFLGEMVIIILRYILLLFYDVGIARAMVFTSYKLNLLLSLTTPPIIIIIYYFPTSTDTYYSYCDNIGITCARRHVLRPHLGPPGHHHRLSLGPQAA